MASVVGRSRSFKRAMSLCLSLALLAPSLAVLTASCSGAATSAPSQGQRIVDPSTGGIYHYATDADIAKMMQEAGARSDGEVYGTGLAPPTETGWKSLAGKLLVLDSLPSVSLGTSEDLSVDPCFPPVGNQGGQGSCAAWAATYYCYGYLEAKDNGWTDASAGNRSHLMSPAWTYNKVNGGVDQGSWMTENMLVICDWGCASMSTMPYTDSNYVNWGSAAAFREAPLHRAMDPVSMPCNGTDWTIDQIKTVVAEGTPVNFAIYSMGVFTGGLTDSYVCTSHEYESYLSFDLDHAQTIVGYNDSVSEDGEVGAFRVVNSWGASGVGDNTDHGYYWFTYEAMKQLLDRFGSKDDLSYILDRPDYSPTLLGVWHFNAAPERDATITLSVDGGESTKEWSPYFVPSNTPFVVLRFPTFMCVDLTDFSGEYASGSTTFHLKFGSSGVAGTLSSFRVEGYEDEYRPGIADRISAQSGNVPSANPCTASVVLAPAARIEYDAALDTTPLSYSSSSLSHWVGIDHISYYDGDALESGDTADSGSSILTVILPGPATYTFYWRVSSEANKDLLKLSVDGAVLATISGSKSWAQKSLVLSTGDHVVNWTYSKDSSGSSGEDAGYVDRLRQLPPDDAFEPNDLAGSAAPIAEGVYNGLVCYDDDWYRVNVDAGFSVYGNISFSDLDGNLDLFLYAPDRTTLLDSSQTRADVESVVTTTGGSGTFYLLVRGVGGVINTYSLEVSIALAPPDISPPTTSLGLSGTVGDNGWYRSTVTVSLAATDVEGPVSWTNYSVDGGAWATYSGPFSVSTDGTHTLRYYSVDEAGNVETTGQATVKVDRTAPLLRTDLAATEGGAGWYVSAVTVQATVSDPTSGVANLRCSIDSGPFSTFAGSFQVTGDGEHNVSVYAVDKAGNPSSVAVLSFKIDAIPPIASAVVSSESAPVTNATIDGDDGWNGWYRSAVNITLEADDSGSGVATTFVSLDDAQFLAYNSTIPVTGEGTHVLRYYSVDVAGNVEDEKSISFGIDTVAPESDAALMGSQGADGWFSGTVNVSIARSDLTSGVVVVRYRIDSGAWSNLSGPLTVAESGEHTLEYYSVDLAGNAEAAHSVTFHVDDDPPETEASAAGPEGTNGWYLGAVKVTLEATDDGYVQTVWQRLDSGNWAIYPYGGVSVASNGRHVLEYYAIDIANNRETTRSLDIWIDADPPSPSISGISPTHSTDGSATISWGTSDAGSGLANTVLWVDGVSRGYSEGLSGTLTISGLPDGTHNVTVVSTDGAGNVGMAYSSFTVDTSYLSPTGPYGPYLLVSFIVTLCAAAVALFLLRKRIR